jgi:hypothetical protein
MTAKKPDRTRDIIEQVPDSVIPLVVAPHAAASVVFGCLGDEPGDMRRLTGDTRCGDSRPSRPLG